MDLRYTEIFYSIQGEAKNTGMLCTWLRTFSCTLECMGFGQKEPGNPETWQPQYTDEQIIAIQSVDQVPTPKYGCDSAYSWSKKFRHVAKKEDTIAIAKAIRATTPNNSFEGKIGHVFTGGEPLMHQNAIAEIIRYWIDTDDIPAWIAFETNGTVELTDVLYSVLFDFAEELGENGENAQSVYFSISPKLLHVAGEEPKKAIKPSVLSQLLTLFPQSYFKFVLNMDQRSWDQADNVISQVENINPDINRIQVWAMPVGGTVEQQDTNVSGLIADKAIAKGWNVSPRVHVLLWKNDQIGR